MKGRFISHNEINVVRNLHLQVIPTPDCVYQVCFIKLMIKTNQFCQIENVKIFNKNNFLDILLRLLEIIVFIQIEHMFSQTQVKIQGLNGCLYLLPLNIKQNTLRHVFHSQFKSIWLKETTPTDVRITDHIVQKYFYQFHLIFHTKIC